MSNNSNSNSASDPGSVGSSSVTSTSIKDVSLEEIQNIRKKFSGFQKSASNYNPNRNRNRMASSDPEMKAAREKAIWYLKHKLEGGRGIKNIENADIYFLALEGKYIRNKLCDKGDQAVCDKAKKSTVETFITLRTALKNKFSDINIDEYAEKMAPELIDIVSKRRQYGGRTRKGRKGTRKGRNGTRRH
jgi:hypothetical protein